jgi:type II secretory pathway pseudopilin PulG
MKNIENKKGFTIIESLVAILILTTAMTSIFAVLSSSLKTTQRIKNETIAASLAHEAIEYVTNLSKTNILDINTQDFLYNMGNCETSCLVDVTSPPPGDLQQCADEECRLNYDSTTNVYTHISGDPTLFKRIVTIVPDPNLYEATATIRIEWDGRSPGEIVLQKVMYSLSL